MKKMICRLLFLIFFSPSALAETLIAEVNGQHIRQGEPFSLTLTFTGNLARLKDAPEPEVDALATDFNVEQISRITFTHFVAGGLEQGVKWQFRLTPLSSGKQVIAGIHLGDLYANVLLIDAEVGMKGAFIRKVQRQPAIKAAKSKSRASVSAPFLRLTAWYSWGAVVAVLLIFSLKHRSLLVEAVRSGNQRIKLRIRMVQLNSSLYKACKSGQPAQAKNALVDIMQLVTFEQPVNALGYIVSHLKASRADINFIRELELLDQQLYAKSAQTSWSGMELWRQYRSMVS